MKTPFGRASLAELVELCHYIDGRELDPDCEEKWQTRIRSNDYSVMIEHDGLRTRVYDLHRQFSKITDLKGELTQMGIVDGSRPIRDEIGRQIAVFREDHEAYIAVLKLSSNRSTSYFQFEHKF